MAVIIPSEAILQPNSSATLESNGVKGFVKAWEGPYDLLETCANNISTGDRYEGYTVNNFRLDTIPGGWGRLSITLTVTNDSGSSGSLVPLFDKWSIKSVRNDVSILAYCGKEDTNPNRGWIEAWMRESDPANAKAGNFTLPDGTSTDLSIQAHCAATSELMAKIEKGIESVIRFYPIVSRTRIYSDCPSECLEDLGFVNTPPAPGSNAKKPQGLASIIQKYSWLKVQDDCNQTNASEWTRIESWMGILKTDGSEPWDPDLYGEERWPMPYDHNASGGGAK